MNFQNDLLKYEKDLYKKGISLIAGVDEVGRGPLAGPVVVTAIIMPKDFYIEGINDSKKLSPKKREELYDIILEKAICCNTVFIDNKEIDESDIYRCTQKAMYMAIEGLSIKPEHVLIDAMPLPNLCINHDSIIHGDAISASISAASIIAKVTRDRYMMQMDMKYPLYGFKDHKGYGTKKHIEAIMKYGPCDIHRKSFAPINRLFCEQLSLDLE